MFPFRYGEVLRGLMALCNDFAHGKFSIYLSLYLTLCRAICVEKYMQTYAPFRSFDPDRKMPRCALKLYGFYVACGEDLFHRVMLVSIYSTMRCYKSAQSCTNPIFLYRPIDLLYTIFRSEYYYQTYRQTIQCLVKKKTRWCGYLQMKVRTLKWRADSATWWA